MEREMTPLVSVIIPVYNVKPFLKKNLNSITKQSYTNLEIIVIDDGSNDGSSELLDSYNDSIGKKIILKHIENSGLSNARNAGINLANGDYLLFLDGDDWLDINSVECLMDIIRKSETKIDLILFPYVREYGNKSLKRNLFPESYRTFHGEEFKEVYKRLFGPIGNELKHPEALDVFSTAWGKLYSKKIVNYVFEPYSVAYPEDILFNIKNLDSVENAVYTESVYLHYNRYEKNLSAVTKVFNFDNFKNSNRLIAIIGEIIKTKDLDTEYSERLASRTILRLFSFMLILSTSSLPFRKKIEYADLIVKAPTNKESFEMFYKNIKLLPTKWQIFYILLRHGHTMMVVGALAIMGKLRNIING